MTFQDLKNHFGSVARAAIAIRVSRQSVNKWGFAGIPEERQFQIQRLTKGALKVDPKVVAKFKALLAA